MIEHNNNKFFQENKSDQTYDDHERNTMNHGVKNKKTNQSDQ